MTKDNYVFPEDYLLPEVCDMRRNNNSYGWIIAVLAAIIAVGAAVATFLLLKKKKDEIIKVVHSAKRRPINRNLWSCWLPPWIAVCHRTG